MADRDFSELMAGNWELRPPPDPYDDPNEDAIERLIDAAEHVLVAVQSGVVPRFSQTMRLRSALARVRRENAKMKTEVARLKARMDAELLGPGHSTYPGEAPTK